MFNFLPLSTKQDWQAALQASNGEPVVIFKHSNTCPISAKAYQKVDNAYQQGDLSAPLYVMIVQDAPQLKLEIADVLEVPHESPQVIVLFKQKSLYAKSHHIIDMFVAAKVIEMATRLV